MEEGGQVKEGQVAGLGSEGMRREGIRRVRRIRTFCASRKHQGVNEQERPASETTRDKQKSDNE